MFNTDLYELIDVIKEEGYDFPEEYYYKNGELNYYKVSKQANLIADELLKDAPKRICIDSFIEQVANSMIMIFLKNSNK